MKKMFSAFWRINHALCQQRLNTSVEDKIQGRRQTAKSKIRKDDLLKINIPPAYKALLTEKHRYYVYWGGRAAGKTYNIATSLIILSSRYKIKVLCCREIMNSIRDSVYEVLCLRIRQMGLEAIYDINQTQITCKITGSTFIFAGLFRNIEKIKSIPEIMIAWVNEANTISQESLDLLIPTIREQNSWLIFEFNPDYEDRPVFSKFVSETPKDCYVRKVSWRDNPYCSSTILAEKDSDFAIRPNEAKWIWEGELKHYGAHVWSPPFDPKIHIKEFDFNTLKDYKVFQALDPHTSYYSASIWAARWRKDSNTFNTWIFSEWPTYARTNAFYSDIRNKLHWTGTVGDLAKEFYATEVGQQISARFIDTRFAKGFGGQHSNLVGTTAGLVQDFVKPENGGMLFQMPQEVAIDRARDQVKKDMQYNTMMPISTTNSPTLFISANCRNTIRSLQHHRFEEDCEKETETYKDHSDCIRIMQAGISEFRWPRAATGSAFNNNFASVSNGWMGT